ncbi:MAG: RNA polymerase Rpb4 family protein [Thermocladium sp.]
MAKRISNYEDISNAEALAILRSIIANYGSSPKLDAVLEYLSKFSKVSNEDAKNMIKELEEKFGITKITAIQLVNILPKSIDEIKSIISSEKGEFKNEELQEMLNILQKHSSNQG